MPMSFWARRSALSEAAREAVRRLQEDEARDRFDKRVCPETDEGYGSRDEPGAHGYGSLDGVPADPEPSEEPDPPDKPLALGGYL